MRPEDIEQFKSSISFFYYDHTVVKIMEKGEPTDILTQKAIGGLDDVLSKYDLHNTQIHQYFKETIFPKLKDFSERYEGKIFDEKEMRKLWEETNKLAEETSKFINSYQNTLISSAL